MRNLLLVAGIAFLVACHDATAPAIDGKQLHSPRSAANGLDLNQSVPSALATVNPCNGDAVALTGTTHVLVHSTEARNGNLHFYTDVGSSYSGLGVPSAVKYTGTAVDRTDFTTNGPYPVVEGIYNEVTLRSATSVANYTLRLHFKITINSAGLPTAEVDDFTTRCGG
jgi:hypothetical protein